MAQPGYSHALATLEVGNAGADRFSTTTIAWPGMMEVWVGEIAVDHMQISPTNTTGGNFDQHFTGAGVWVWNVAIAHMLFWDAATPWRA